MSKIIRFQVTEKIIDNNYSQNIIDGETSVIEASFDSSNIQQYSIPNSNTFFPINFGNITQTTMVRFNSTEPVTINLGSQSFEGVYDFIFKTNITSLQVKNISGNTAYITIQIYGS